MSEDKKILAIETSGELCSVAISFSPEIYDERNILMKHIHSEKLIPMIDELFRSNNMSSEELEIIAVSNGPGSFTGLRIGMTAAKGIAFASYLPIVPVPTFNALSLEIKDYLKIDTTFYIVNNANIDECYFSKYMLKNGNVQIVEEPRLKEKSKLNNNLAETELVFGNFKALEGIKNISSPRASSIAKWTYLFGEDLLIYDYDFLEPNYLKNFKVKQ